MTAFTDEILHYPEFSNELTGGIQGIWNLIKDKAGQALEDVANEAKESFESWIEDRLIPAIKNHITMAANGLWPNDYYLFSGAASQSGKNLSGPGVTGPGSIVDDSVTVDLEVDGLGFKLKLERNLEVDLNIPVGVNTGFSSPGGPTSISVDCCETPQEAIVADRIGVKGSLIVTVTIILLETSVTGDGTDQLGDADVKIYNSTHSLKPTSPPEKPAAP